MSYNVKKSEKINKLIKEIEQYKLEVSQQFKQCSIEKLEKEYNGCGADWMPSETRNILTWCFVNYEPAFLIHDIDFYFSDKSEDSFHLANRRLYSNCRKIIKKTVPFWRFLKRITEYEKCELIYFACELFGWGAWKD